MKLFNIRDLNITIDPAILSVTEFKEVWDADKSKNKAEAYNTFRWIYYMCDASSPYANFPENTKLEYINQDCFKTKKYNPDKIVESAMLKYRELSETPIQRLFKSVKGKIDDISLFLTETEVDEKTLKSILDVIEKTSKLVTNMANLEDAVNKEMQSSVKARGNKEIGLYEL